MCAAAQRAVQGDLAGQQRAAGLHQLLRGGDQRALGIEYVQKAGGAVVVGQARQAGAFLLHGQRLALDLHLLGEPAACRQRVGHFAEGGLHRLLVLRHGQIAAHFGQVEVGLISAAVKDR